MQHGVFYLNESTNGTTPTCGCSPATPTPSARTSPTSFHAGEGLVGQSALERKPILISNVPDDYVQISSGLGQAKPLNIVVLPDPVRRRRQGGHRGGVVPTGSPRASSPS